MQSLDSSCQEADFIINDTLKKLKGSNPKPASNRACPNSSVLRQVSYQTQNKHQNQHQQCPLMGTPPHADHQQTYTPQATQLQYHLSSPLSPHNIPPIDITTNSFSKNSLLDSSLLHCNINEIPSQPPYCIFDDGPESPSSDMPPPRNEDFGGRNSSAFDNITLFGVSTSTKSAMSPTSSSISANLSTFNSITSPSPVVPEMLLSTPPPGINLAPSAIEITTTTTVAATTSTILNAAPQQQQLQQQRQLHFTQTQQTKADKRPSSSHSSSHTNNSNNSKNYQSSLISFSQSPVASPSKRQKTKDNHSSTTSNKSSNTSRSNSSGKRDPAATPATSGSVTMPSLLPPYPLKFFNIQEKIKELYLQLLSNDLNVFAESGVKHRTRSFVLEQLVQNENLNTIVVNLYPGNKGYALALHYDDRQCSLLGGDSNCENSNNPTISLATMIASASSLASTSSPSSSTASNKSASSRNSKQQNQHSISNTTPITSDLHASKVKDDISSLEKKQSLSLQTKVSSGIDDNEYNLIEVMRWPYEIDDLLQCIDKEVIPEFLMDLLAAPTLTSANEPPQTYRKPNVFYSGCVICEIRDFRQTFGFSTNTCDIKHVLLKPTNSMLYTDVQHLAVTANLSVNAASMAEPTTASLPRSYSTTAAPQILPSPEDKLALESQIVLATAEPLCLDPDPSIGRFAVNAQHERQKFNAHELRRQMKKFTQISINRKRKLDQFTQNYGLELCDFLIRLRQKRGLSISLDPSGNVTNDPANKSTGANKVGTGNSTSSRQFLSKDDNAANSIGATSVPCTSNPLLLPTSFTTKLPRRPMITYHKFDPDNRLPPETTDYQPQLVEERILETKREDNEGRRVIYHIKLSIFQRPSDCEYLGELYVDRDYRKGERNGESCRFSLGTRSHANRYIQQFTEIFTEEGRKAVKITHCVPGHEPKVTHTGITPEQRQALLQQQQQQQQLQLQQQQQALLVAQQQQQLQQVASTSAVQQQPQQQPQQPTQMTQHVVVVGANEQQQHIIQPPVGINSNNQQQAAIAPGGSTSKNINIVGITPSNAAAVHQVLRQHHQQQQQQQQPQQQQITQFIDASGSTLQLQATNVITGGATNAANSLPAQHIQLHQLGAGGNTTTHQLSLSNGSLVFVQQPQRTPHQQHQQHASITIQPTNIIHQQQQQHSTLQQAQVMSGSLQNAPSNSGSSAVRSQLTSSVPILQAQLKAAPINTGQPQQHIVHQQKVSNPANTQLHTNSAISAIVTSIINSTNQWQQQQQEPQQQQQQQQQRQQQQMHQRNSLSVENNISSNIVSSNSSNTQTPTTSLKNSSNASILSLLNSAPAAMTSTPVASGTFTTSTGQQSVSLVPPPPSQPPSLQQQHQQQNVITADSFTHASQSQPPTSQQQHQQLQRKQQNILNSQLRKINIVSNVANAIGGNVGATATFRTNAAGNLIAVNLNPSQDSSTQSQQQSVRVSMSALASQLASPPAIMTNSSNFGYTVSTGNAIGGGGTSGSIKILNSALNQQHQQQQRVLANALRRDSSSVSLNHAIVGSGTASGGVVGGVSGGVGGNSAVIVGVAAPSPSSDSNASNASGFAMPQITVNASSASTNLNALLATASPSPSGSDHSQSSAISQSNQVLLEKLNSGSANIVGVAATVASSVGNVASIPNMSPHNQAPNQQQQQQSFLTKSLVQQINAHTAQSPAGGIASVASAASSISPMSSPHPLQSPSPHQQQNVGSSSSVTTGATLNLQGINFTTLQGAMANFPGLQNVQVQIPGFTQPISLQAAVQQQQQQQSSATVSVVQNVISGTDSGSVNGNSNGNISSTGQQHTTQRSLLVSVPVSSTTQQQQSHQQIIHPQHLQQHQQHIPQKGTIVNLSAGTAGTAGTPAGTQAVVLSNNAIGTSINVTPTSGTGSSGYGGGAINSASSGAGGTTATMLSLPIAQFVASGVKNLNPLTMRTPGGGIVGNVVNSGTAQQQQQPQHQQKQQTQQQQQQQLCTVGIPAGNAGNLAVAASAPTSAGTVATAGPAVITQQNINLSGTSGTNVASAPNINAVTQPTMQLVGALQQRARNIQVVSAKQIAGRQLITASSRNIAGSTLKIAAAPINAQNINAITTNANITATPIVMATQKLQLKTVKGQQQQQQHRILSQVATAVPTVTQQQQQQQSTASQTMSQNQQQQQQLQTVIIGQQLHQQQAQQHQHIQITGRTATGNLSQRTINAIAAAAAANQQKRRRSATDVNK